MGERGVGSVESRFSGILGAAVVGAALYVALKPMATKESKTNNRETIPNAGAQSDVGGPWVEPPPDTGISALWSGVNQRVLQWIAPARTPKEPVVAPAPPPPPHPIPPQYGYGGYDPQFSTFGQYGSGMPGPMPPK